MHKSLGRRELEAKMAPVGRTKSVLQGPTIVLMLGSADIVLYSVEALLVLVLVVNEDVADWW